MADSASLSAREKGDIYWRKLKYYLNAEEKRRKDKGEGKKGKNLAKEILALDSGALMEGIRSGRYIINGNEFKLRPPTATGERLHKYSILLVMLSRDYYNGILENDAAFSGADKDLQAQLKKLVGAMDDALNVWFASNGINLSDGGKLSKVQREEAAAKSDGSIKAYESAVKDFKLGLALRIIERLTEELPEDTAEESGGTEFFEELIAADPGDYRLHKSKITRAIDEYKILREKRLEYTKDIPLLEELIEKKGRYTMVNSIMTLQDAFVAYKDHMDSRMAGQYWAEQGCKSLVEALLSDEPADPMIANYIRCHWDLDVPAYPILNMVETLPGYKKAEEPDTADSFLCKDLDEMTAAKEELMAYKEEHFELFQFQTIKTILFGSDELPLIEAKAKGLRSSIAMFVREGKNASFTEEEEKAFEEAWLIADTMSRVAFLVLEYRNSSARRVLRDMIENFPAEAYEMNYYVQERRCREYMEKFMQLKGKA